MKSYNYLVPTVIEKDSRGERAYDLYSRLLRERIIFIGTPIDDNIANVIIAQLLFLQMQDPQKEIHDYCEQQATTLDSYAWVDQSAGIVRIPVDRAIELTLKNGLPSRPAGQVPAELATPAASSAQDPQGVTGQCGYLHEEIERKQELTNEVEEEAAKSKQ